MADPTKRVIIPSRKTTKGVGSELNVQTEPFQVQTPVPARKIQHGVGNTGSNVKLEPIDHLIQPIKQYDARLYEALKRLATQATQNVDQIVQNFQNTQNTTQAVAFTQQDKVTFGLIKRLEVTDSLTLYYICRRPGKWVDVVAKIATQCPVGRDAILDIKRSVDDGANWVSIFPNVNSSKIVLKASKYDLVTVKKFALTDVSKGDLLRIDCLQTGLSESGYGIEVVGRWVSDSPTNV